MPRCHVCGEPREPEDEGYLVALRNGLYFPACFRHWLMWPDEHKAPSSANPDLQLDETTRRLLRETAS